MKKFAINKECVLIIITLVLCYFPLFLHLGSLPIRIWDEARLAINAIEMLQNHNFIVTYHENSPDMWNTKPPLLIWIQALFIKAFGVDEISVRLPSAIAALFTCIVLYQFSRKYLKNYLFGIISVLVLITSQGYVHYHGTRTGDYDSLLTLFTTLFCLHYFLYFQYNHLKYLYLFFLSLTLSVLTKGIQPLIFIPALFIYSILNFKIFKELLKNRHLYFNITIFFIITIGYYLWRDALNPGYLKTVFTNEIGGRYLETLEFHKHPFNYYFDNIVTWKFSYWLVALISGIFIGLFSVDDKIRKLTFFCLIITIAYLLIISNSNTKLEWYDLPLYPFFAILSAVAINYLIQFFESFKEFNSRLKANIIPHLILFIIFLSPYRKIIDEVYFPKEYDFTYNSIPMMMKSIHKNDAHRNYVICWKNDTKTHLDFQILKLSNAGLKFEFKDSDKLSPGDMVIASEWDEKSYIENHYKYKLLKEKAEAKMYEIE